MCVIYYFFANTNTHIQSYGDIKWLRCRAVQCRGKFKHKPLHNSVDCYYLTYNSAPKVVYSLLIAIYECNSKRMTHSFTSNIHSLKLVATAVHRVGLKHDSDQLANLSPPFLWSIVRATTKTDTLALSAKINCNILV